MVEIRRYVLVDRNDHEGPEEYANLDEAINAAQVLGEGEAVIARVYEYTDSELVWTPDGSDTWPPGTDRYIR